METSHNSTSKLGRGFRLLLLVCCLLALGTCTQVRLWAVNTLAQLGDYTQTADIAYGPDPLNRLDIYIPAGDRAPGPTVVFFYGGCWGGCQTVTREYYRFVGEALTSSGLVAVIADYRRHPQVKFPQIMDDVSAAVTWVSRHIDDYGGDAERIFLMGHSAGAHLAAMLTLNETYLEAAVRERIRGAIGLAGPYDFSLTKPYQKTLFGPQENYPASQPVNFVDGDEPPMLLLHGLDDTVVKKKNPVNLAAEINRLAGRVQIRLYPDVSHAGLLAALSRPLRDRYPVLGDIADFIQSSETVARPTGAISTSESDHDL